MADKTDFIIPKDGYLAFDAITLKQFIKDRLNQTNIFTDQNYEGSYITTVNEIIAYVFNMLMYYLNKTSTESMFSESTIYENMNRIVKLLDYKPIGRQTAVVKFGLTVSNLPKGIYTIPRYAYIITKTVANYSFNEDIVFNKSIDNTSEDMDLSVRQKLLYQGRYREYPQYSAIGDNNEVVYLVPGDNVLIDHFSIDVYVKPIATGIWEKWNKTTSLYTENGLSKSYECRLNESKRYEIKFGNDINGVKLNQGDLVQIYYLESNGKDGEITVGILNGCKLKVFMTPTLEQILTDLNSRNVNELSYVNENQASNLVFSNTETSTYYSEEETADEIRNNAPGVYRSQYRCVTINDYENYVKTNFSNLVYDVKCANNWQYLSKQMRYYFEDVGLSKPEDIANVMYNQLYFADSCNFNNIYLTVLPKNIVNPNQPLNNLSSSQKELIISSLQDVKSTTSEIVILDPVYIAVDLCLFKDDYQSLSIADVSKTELYVVKNPNAGRDVNSIQRDIYQIFVDYFSRSNLKLGDELNISYLTEQILSVSGVKQFYTRRTDDTSIARKGLSMLLWNPVYPTDINLTTKNESMDYFKYMYFNNISNLINRITVTNEDMIYQSIEY